MSKIYLSKNVAEAFTVSINTNNQPNLKPVIQLKDGSSITDFQTLSITYDKDKNSWIYCVMIKGKMYELNDEEDCKIILEEHTNESYITEH